MLGRNASPSDIVAAGLSNTHRDKNYHLSLGGSQIVAGTHVTYYIDRAVRLYGIRFEAPFDDFAVQVNSIAKYPPARAGQTRVGSNVSIVDAAGIVAAAFSFADATPSTSVTLLGGAEHIDLPAGTTLQFWFDNVSGVAGSAIFNIILDCVEG